MERKVYNAKVGKNYFKSAPALYENGKKLADKSDFTYVTQPRYEYAEDLIEKDENGNVVPKLRRWQVDYSWQGRFHSQEGKKR